MACNAHQTVEKLEMTKTELERAKHTMLRDRVRELPQGEHLDVTTDYSARKLAYVLQDVKDADGYWKTYKCSAIAAGVVRVSSVYTFKITNVRSI